MKDYKYGFIDQTGNFVIEPKFEMADSFSEGLACVSTGNGKYGYIDKTGRFVIAPRFKNGEIFSEGLARVENEDGFGFIDKTGRIVIEPFKWYNYSGTSHFEDGLARIFNYENKYGFIDKSGRVVIEPQFASASHFCDGRSFVSFDKKQIGLIDKTGKFIVEPKFKAITGISYRFSEGIAAIVMGPIGIGYDGVTRPHPNDKFGYIDKTGKYVIKPNFEYASNFSEGLALAGSREKHGFINNRGQFVFLLDNRFMRIGEFHNNRARVRLDNKEGYIDNSGKIAIDPKYDYVDDFEDGLACVYLGGKHGLIDTNGRFVIEPTFDEHLNFSEGLAYVKVEVEHKVIPVSESKPPVSSPKPPASTPKPTDSTPKPSERAVSQTQPNRQQPTPKQKPKSGCYIATAIYGSYDCPEVWTLRRYRDNVLDNSWYGRLFIRCYYAMSPTLVKWFGTTAWFRKIFSKPLNRLAGRLNKRGFSNTPYKDK